MAPENEKNCDCVRYKKIISTDAILNVVIDDLGSLVALQRVYDV